MRHRVVLDSDLADSLWRLPARSRREIISIFERLADFPFTGVEDRIRAHDPACPIRQMADLFLDRRPG